MAEPAYGSRSRTRLPPIRSMASNFSSSVTEELIERSKEPLIKTSNDGSRVLTRRSLMFYASSGSTVPPSGRQIRILTSHILQY